MAEYIDFDTHVFEPISVWDDYIDPQYKGQGPVFFNDTDGRMKMRLDDQVFPKALSHGGYLRNYGPDSKRDRSGNDPRVRLKYMDAQDVDVQVIFPSLGMAGFSVVRDPELATALSRAYNRYMGEFTSVDRRRLRGAMLLPVNHPEYAAAEMRRARKDEGLQVAFVNPTPPDDIPWADARYDVFWRAAEECGVTVVFHESTAGATESAVGITRYKANWDMVSLCTPVIEAILAISDLILGGTLEKFPKLKVGSAEAHVQWLPGWLALLDQHCGMGAKIIGPSADTVKLSMKPSEYFRRQCFLAAFPDDSLIAEAYKAAPESILVISDYPHPIAAEKGADGVRGIEKNPTLTPAMVRALLIDNPARFL